MSQELHDERISAYLDGELSPSERAEMDELLKTSSSHQQMLVELTSLRESLQSLPHYTLGNDFADRVTVAAQKAAKEAAPEVRPTLRPAAASATGRKWLLSIAGGVAVVAACIAMVVYSFSGGPVDNMAKVEAKGEGEEGKGSVDSNASEFVRTLASTQENEAVVVRVKLTKDAIRGRMLDEALKAHGIQLATADVSNEAARQTGLAYKEQIKSQIASAANRGAADVLFLEANAEDLEKALSDLEKNSIAKAAFAPESLVASIGKGPSMAAKPEGEPGSAGTETKVPTGGYFQHMPPQGFKLAPATAAAIKPGDKVPAKKSARVLIVVEVVE
ncbi:MAG: zf-HC2 domain-containing protein [Planctomycetales bacterium]|nr:zf-HC2 domain-containing protein [Planctomycetales bacterium]